MTEYNTSSFWDGQIDALYKSLSEMTIDYQAINDSILSGFQELLDSTTKILTENYAELLTASLYALVESMAGLPIDELQAESYISVPVEKLEPLLEMTQFVPEDKQEEFQEIIAPERGKKSKIITLENFYKIATLVLAILTLVRPISVDDETKEIMREHNEINQRQVEINLERNEIEHQKAASMDKIVYALTDFFEYVKESGICIQKQTDVTLDDIDFAVNNIDAIKNNVDTVDNIPIPKD